jgi:hypothetical protein
MTGDKEPGDDDRRVDEAIAESFRRATRPPGRWASSNNHRRLHHQRGSPVRVKTEQLLF